MFLTPVSPSSALRSAVSHTSAHSTQMSLPLLFATVHLLAFQKCFYDLSHSIEYLNSGRGGGRISLPSGPARPSQLRLCRSAWPLVLAAAHDGWIQNMGCQSSDVMLLKQFLRFVILYLIGWFALKCLCKRHHQILRKNILFVQLFKDTNGTTLTVVKDTNCNNWAKYSELNQLLYRTSTYRVRLSTTNTEIANI